MTGAAIAKERSKTLGKALLGGDWELVNAASKKVTNQDFIGKWVMLYFGFTHCPDICPDELEKLVEVVDKIGEFGQSLYVIWRSVFFFFSIVLPVGV